MPVKKHIPQRTCVACRETKNKRDLIRIVKMPELAIIVDETGKAQGRGAYLCRRLECWQNGLSRGAISRALKTTLSPQDQKVLETYAADHFQAG